MSYQFLVQLPQHLETAYQAGDIVINGGVARYVGSQRIAAHLEQALPIAGQVLGMSNPPMALLGSGLHAIKTVKGMVVDTAMLNRVLTLTQQVKTLSTINVALSGVTLGVTAVGFPLVLHRLNTIDQKINVLGQQLGRIASQQQILMNHKLLDLVGEVRQHIKHCLTLSRHIQEQGWSQAVDLDIAKILDSTEVLLDKVLHCQLHDNHLSISTGLAHSLYQAYSELLTCYLTSRYLNKQSLLFPASRLEILSNATNTFISRDMMDSLYEDLIMQREQILTETEIDILLSLYCQSCKQVQEKAHISYEILEATPLGQFKRWQKQLLSSKSEFVWIDHHP